MSGTIRRSVAFAVFAALLLGIEVPSVSAAEADELVVAVVGAPLEVATPGPRAINAPAVDLRPEAPLVQRQPERSQVTNPSLRVGLYVSFATLQALDAHSTMRAIAAGGREANPLMGGIASNSAALLTVKAGTAAATIYLAERLGKKKPLASLVMMAALNTAYATIVSHNYAIARGR